MTRVLIILLSLSLWMGCDPSSEPADGGAGDALPSSGDEDGDGISDEDEGRGATVGGTDTDGDGTPDYLDDDSDGDGIPDRVEAGDTDPNTAPSDADQDGIPNFRDLDSDNNGLPDRDESLADTDGDGRADYEDGDDDNDLVSDAIELRDHPADTDWDGDGLVDFKDPDRDDDTILDGHEVNADTDGDGVDDWGDLDSDADGLSDALEAGDTDLRTVPVDTDMDSIPDFRDPDSDNDGLSDLDEVNSGTSPILVDSDGDGVSDLIEVAGGTDPLDGSVSPRTEGNFVFVLPWMEPAMPERDTLEFKTNIQFADVYFVFDRSGSMSGEINAMRDAVRNVLGNLRCMDFGVACAGDDECGDGQVCSFEGSCVQDPAVSTCVPSLWSGAGHYESSYTNILSLQSDHAMTGTRIGTIRTGGGDEDFFEMATCVATGCGGGCTTVAGRVGCPSFRPEAVKMLIAFTDENSDGGTLAAAAAGMNMAGIKFIGVWSGSRGSGARGHMDQLATQTMSTRADGSLLVFEGMDAAVAPAVTAAINEVVEGVPLRVTIEAMDAPGDDGDALRFIDHLVVNTSGGACTAVALTEDTNADGHDDAFPAVRPGTSVCWDVVPFQNDDIQEPAASPLVYQATLRVFGDGSPLDERTVFFVVPPRIEVPQGPG